MLPTYAAFIAAGFLAYGLAVGEMGRYLTRIGLAHWRGPAEVATHALCAVGVVLGRVARLNSWEPMTEPHGTAERIVLTLSWRGAPFAVLVTFAVIWVCHGATRALVRHGIAAAGPPPPRSAGWPDESVRVVAVGVADDARGPTPVSTSCQWPCVRWPQ